MMRCLVIGLGSIGRRHTRNIAALSPGTAFTFLRRNTDPDPLIAEVGGRVITALDDADYDLAVLATPSALHIDHLPTLIARGLPLLVEKPVITTRADGETLLTQLASAPSAVRVAAFNFRHIPSLGMAREIIASGKLGRVVRATLTAGQWLPDWRPTQDYRAGYSASPELGGGVELDLVHEIDLARWFFGDLTLRYALGGKLSALEIGTNDVATLLLAPQAGPPIVTVSLDYVSRQRVRRYEIVGDRGSLIWDIAGHLTLRGPGGETRILCEEEGGFNIAASYIDMLARLFAARDGHWAAPLQTLEDGIASSLLAIAAREEGHRQ